jgi:hypothetical protein
MRGGSISRCAWGTTPRRATLKARGRRPLTEQRARHAGRAIGVAHMNTLYNSESFAVVHLLPEAEHQDATDAAKPTLMRQGFEIVDKRSGKEVYLDGSWADLFEARIADWQKNTPTQEEVEQALAGYAELAQNPVVLH